MTPSQIPPSSDSRFPTDAPEQLSRPALLTSQLRPKFSFIKFFSGLFSYKSKKAKLLSLFENDARTTQACQGINKLSISELQIFYDLVIGQLGHYNQSSLFLAATHVDTLKLVLAATQIPKETIQILYQQDEKYNEVIKYIALLSNDHVPIATQLAAYFSLKEQPRKTQALENSALKNLITSVEEKLMERVEQPKEAKQVADYFKKLPLQCWGSINFDPKFIDVSRLPKAMLPALLQELLSSLSPQKKVVSQRQCVLAHSVILYSRAPFKDKVLSHIALSFIQSRILNKQVKNNTLRKLLQQTFYKSLGETRVQEELWSPLVEFHATFLAQSKEKIANSQELFWKITQAYLQDPKHYSQYTSTGNFEKDVDVFNTLMKNPGHSFV